MKTTCWTMLWALACASVAGATEFTSKPIATADGKNAVIKFAVDKPCDVAMAVVDKDGKVVRHLAAGVLGETAPAPFKPGALEQAVAWDGNDDSGNPLPPGAYKAKVSLGLGVKLDQVIGDDRRPVLTLNALAVGPKGELYVCQGGQVNVYDRDGKYLRQVMPFPANLPLDRLAGLDPVRLPDGSLFCRREYPSGKGAGEVIGSMAVSPDGKTLYLPGPPRYARNLMRIGTDGSVPANAFDTRLTTLSDNGFLWLACSPDGKTLYVSGAQAGYEGDDARALCYRQAIYRLKLDSAGPSESFTGDDENAGSNGFYVSTPKGVATDPAGRVYVCNYSGGNVAVYTPGAGFLKSFKVQFPQQVAVNPRTGQLYVLSGRESARTEDGYRHAEVMHEAKIVRLSAAGQVEKELTLDPPSISKRRNKTTGEFFRQPEFRLRMAADFSVPEKPVVWVGVTAPAAWYCKWGLLRIEDLGDTFGERKDLCPHDAGAVPGSMNRMCLDRERDLLYLANGADTLKRYNALDGALLDPIRVKDHDGTDTKVSISEPAVGPNGVIYFLGTPEGSGVGRVFRCGPDGKLIPYTGGHPKVAPMLKGSRGFTASRAGEVYVLYYDGERPPDQSPPEPWDRSSPYPTALAKFASDGQCATMRLVSYLRGGANGVRVDSKGAIYVADNFMPAGVAYPTDLAKVMPEDPLKRDYPARLADASFDPLLRWMGCILKFGPEGGRVVGLPEDQTFPPAQRAASDVYRPVPETQWSMYNYHNLKVIGAQWQFHGISPMPSQYQGVTHVERCICSGARFDIDPFDRVFVPDTLRHRFTVLDSAGNVICRFGRYGNLDSDGLGLASAASVAADGDYAFLGDAGNRRLVKVKFTYAAEAACDLKR